MGHHLTFVARFFMNILIKLVDTYTKNFQSCVMNMKVAMWIAGVNVERVFLSLLIIVIPNKPGMQ